MSEQPEPRVVYATVRDSLDAEGEAVLDIECRFEDGQKFAPIQIDAEFPELAHRIAMSLSQHCVRKTNFKQYRVG